MMVEEKLSEGLKVKYTNGLMDKMRENPWMVATCVLAVLLVVSLIASGFGGLTGGTVSASKASDNLLSFIKAQGQGEATFVSASKDGSLYQITVDYKDQSIPVYVTSDGKYLISSVIPLTASATASSQPAQQENVPKTDKPVVELFVMSYCPYGTQAEKGILPAANLLKDKIDFTVKFVYYAMHGQKEVNENVAQYCIQKEQATKYSNYLSCFLQSGDEKSCLASAGIDQTKLNSCISSTNTQFKITQTADAEAASGNYPQFDIYKDLNAQYGVQGSPTLIINGVESSAGRSPDSYLAAICDAFSTAPSECNTKLSSDTPSPGFGGSASSGSGSTATCS